MTYNDEQRKEYLCNWLKDFMRKNSCRHGFAGWAADVFPINAASLSALADYLFNEMVAQTNWFKFECKDIVDKDKKTITIPYENSDNIWFFVLTLREKIADKRHFGYPIPEDATKLLGVLEAEYERVSTEEEKERQRREAEEKERKEYQEYIRLKKKYEDK